MADNVGITPGSGAKAASREVTYSGETAQVQVVGLATLDGSDDAKTVADISGSNPLPTQESGGAMSLLSRILNVLMSPMGFDRSLSRQRVTGIIESGTVTTVTTVTTCTTVSSLTNVAAIGGYSAQVQVLGINLTAWAQCVRARIT
jgi:hypothetical protein